MAFIYAPPWPAVPPGGSPGTAAAYPAGAAAPLISRWALSQRLTGALWVANRLADAVFIADILLTFNTAVYDASFSRLESRRRAIARRYARGGLALDLASTLPYDLVPGLDAWHSLRLLRLLRVARAARVLARLEDAMSLPPIQARSRGGGAPGVGVREREGERESRPARGRPSHTRSMRCH